MYTYGKSLAAACVAAVLVTAISGSEAAAKSKPPAPELIGEHIGDFAARQLDHMAQKAGVAIEAEHTVVLVREDVVLVAAPVLGIASISSSQLFDGTETDVGVAYICAPCGALAEEGAMPADLYRLSVRSPFDPTTGDSRLELVCTGRSGEQFVWPGLLVWADDKADPDPSLTRIDVAVHELDQDTKPVARDIVIQIWIQVESLRGCWKWVIKSPF